MKIMLKVKCSSCNEVKTLTEEENKEADQMGMCMCKKCYMPMMPVEASSL